MTSESIRALRKSLGVNRTVFAEMLGVAEISVESWERGIRFPNGRTLLKMQEIEREKETLKKLEK